MIAVHNLPSPMHNNNNDKIRISVRNPPSLHYNNNDDDNNNDSGMQRPPPIH